MNAFFLQTPAACFGDIGRFLHGVLFEARLFLRAIFFALARMKGDARV